MFSRSPHCWRRSLAWRRLPSRCPPGSAQVPLAGFSGRPSDGASVSDSEQTTMPTLTVLPKLAPSTDGAGGADLHRRHACGAGGHRRSSGPLKFFSMRCSIRKRSRQRALPAARPRLDLTAAQAEAVRDIIASRQEALLSIRRDVQPRVEIELTSLESDIAAVLNDAQRAEWRVLAGVFHLNWLPPVPAAGPRGMIQPGLGARYFTSPSFFAIASIRSITRLL